LHSENENCASDWVPKDLIFKMETLTVGKTLGNGNYGVVHKGLFKSGNAVSVFYVERSSTIECYCQPPPNLEMIASKQACFIRQINIFI
jgi:hypothetical protein